MDSTRAISEGTGEKDTKKALEFRRKEVSWIRCYDFVFWWCMNWSLSRRTLQELKTFEGPLPYIYEGAIINVTDVTLVISLSGICFRSKKSKRKTAN